MQTQSSNRKELIKKPSPSQPSGQKVLVKRQPADNSGLKPGEVQLRWEDLTDVPDAQQPQRMEVDLRELQPVPKQSQRIEVDLSELQDIPKQGLGEIPFITILRLAKKHGLETSSGKRTPEGNAAVGGAPTSYHLSGNALDFKGPADRMKAFAQELYDNFEGYAELLHDGFPATRSRKNDHSDHVHIAWKGPSVSVGRQDGIVLDWDDLQDLPEPSTSGSSLFKELDRELSRSGSKTLERIKPGSGGISADIATKIDALNTNQHVRSEPSSSLFDELDKELSGRSPQPPITPNIDISLPSANVPLNRNA